MAGYDLSIDMATLSTLAADLTSIVDELENANGHAEAAADLVGDDHLRDRVNDFADKWRIKRQDMVGDVKGLSDILTAIVDNFTQVDADLAKALEDTVEKQK